MAYPSDLLSSRAVIRPGKFALIPPEGLVKNIIPGTENCNISVVAAPKLGAGFVQYLITLLPDGGTTAPFAAEEGVQSFVYCISGGEGIVGVGQEQRPLKEGVYAYAPAGMGLVFRNTSASEIRLLVHKQRYQPLQGYDTWPVFGNANEIEYRNCDDMETLQIKDLLPIELGFDLNFHILSFLPGGSHNMIETHVQEHGAYILSGEGAYYMGEQWRMVKKNDYIWLGAFTTQGAYCVGRERFTYVYSKDWHRDVKI